MLFRSLLALCLAGALFARWPSSVMIAWRESTPAPEPRSGYAAGVLGGRLVLIGGTYWEGTKGNWTRKVFSAAMHVFEPAAQSWTKLPDAPFTLGYAAHTYTGEALYVIGGLQNGQPSREVHVVRQQGSRYEWQRLAPLPEVRLFGTAVAARGKIYLVGGVREFEPLDDKGACCTSRTAVNTLWVLDPAAPSPAWKALAPIPGASRWAHQALADESAIYVFGGRYQAQPHDPVRKLNEVVRYDLTRGHWSRVADLPEELQQAAPVRARDKIILVGLSRKVARFDPASATFSPLDPLPREALVDRFVWIDPLLVGASGENRVEGPRRRSEWTFLGRVSELLPPLPEKPPPFVKVAGWPRLPAAHGFSNKVSHVAADSEGRVYVADRGPHPIKVFSPSGELIRTIGGDTILPSVYFDLRQTPPAPMESRPWVHGLHLDAADNVWVTDVGRHVVMKYSPEGKLLLTLGTPDRSGETPATFSQPTSVLVAPSGNVFVADGYGNSRIVKFNARGEFIRAWGQRGLRPGEFHSPHCLAMDSRGRLYVSDRENHRVQIFDQDGRFLSQWSNLHSLDAIFITRDDRIYGGAGTDDRIYRFDDHGRVVEQWGNDGIFGYPHGICLDREGNLYVAQTGAGRVDKFRPVR